VTRTVLSTKHLYALLANSPDRPSISTVKRWVEGKQEMPSWALAVIAESLGLPVAGTQKEAPPHWAARLLSRVDEIYDRQSSVGSEMSEKVIAALAPALAPLDQLAVAEDVLRRLESLLPRLDEASDGQTDEQGPGAISQPGPTSG
jgi:hypothetical protein